MTAFEKAIWQYYNTKKPVYFPVATNLGDVQDYESKYFFRSFDEMPPIEQQALLKSTGKILDVGAGVGAHALWFQNQNKNVTALEISEVLCEIMKNRGVKNIENQNIFQYFASGFDTILLLMNGIGICGTIKNCSKLLLHLKSLLTENGQIFIDSADILEIVGEQNLSPTAYYGEIEYQVSYKNQKDQPFEWLFIDFFTLQEIAEDCGLSCELVLKGFNNDYLARLRPKN